MNSTKRLRNHLHLHHPHLSNKSAGTEVGEGTPLLTNPISISTAMPEPDRPTHTRFINKSFTNAIQGEPTPTPPNRIPLLLDDEQMEMIRNLNTLPLERVITFWPWCWNTHAMLVVRYVLFPSFSLLAACLFLSSPSAISYQSTISTSTSISMFDG